MNPFAEKKGKLVLKSDPNQAIRWLKKQENNDAYLLTMRLIDEGHSLGLESALRIDFPPESRMHLVKEFILRSDASTFKTYQSNSGQWESKVTNAIVSRIGWPNFLKLLLDAGKQNPSVVENFLSWNKKNTYLADKFPNELIELNALR